MFFFRVIKKLILWNYNYFFLFRLVSISNQTSINNFYILCTKNISLNSGLRPGCTFRSNLLTVTPAPFISLQLDYSRRRMSSGTVLTVDCIGLWHMFCLALFHYLQSIIIVLLCLLLLLILYVHRVIQKHDPGVPKQTYF